MPEEMPPQNPVNEDTPIETTPQMPTQETPQYASPEPEQTTPWTPEAASTEESVAAPEAASSEMPASEDPNKINISESDLNSSEPSEADAEKKIDLMDSFSAPTSEASSEEPAAPQAGSGDRIDLTDALGAPSESIAAPESQESPTDAIVTGGEPSEMSPSVEQDEGIAQEIAKATDAQNTIIAALEKNTDLSPQRKEELINLMKETAGRLEEQVRQDHEKYSAAYDKIQEVTLSRLAEALRSTVRESIFHTDFAYDNIKLGVYGSDTYEEIDQAHSAKLSNFVLKLLGSDEKSLLSTQTPGTKDIVEEHPITIDGQSAKVVESYYFDGRQNKYVYRIDVIREPAAVAA